MKLVSRVHLILHHIRGVDRRSQGKLAEMVLLFESHSLALTVGQWVIRTRLCKEWEGVQNECSH